MGGTKEEPDRKYYKGRWSACLSDQAPCLVTVACRTFLLNPLVDFGIF